MRGLGVGILTGVFLVGSRPVVGAPPVARVLAVRGDVSAQTAQKTPRPARTYGALFVDDVLKVPANATIDVVFRQRGVRAKVGPDDVDRSFHVGSGGLAPPDGVVMIEPPEKLKGAVVASVGDLPSIAPGGVSILRGPAPKQAIARIRPIDNGGVLTVTPVFEWPAAKDAEHYEFELLDQYNKPITKQTVAESRFAAPADNPLKPGRRYRWTVTAVNGDDRTPVCRAEFVVVNPKFGEDVAALAGADDAALWALAACSYEKLGLVDQAVEAYEKLRRAQPDDPVFPAALSDLYERLGDSSRAAAARDEAEKRGFVFKQQPGSSK